MGQITVKMQDGACIRAEAGISLAELYERNRDCYGEGIVAAKVNNRLSGIHGGIYEDSEVEFLDTSRTSGFRVYQRSAAFLLIYAVKAVLGPKAGIIIKHSINKNLYCALNGSEDISVDLVNGIAEVMNAAVRADMPFEQLTVSVEEGRRILRGFGNEPMLKSLKFYRGQTISLYKLDFYYDYFYGPVVPSAGLIKNFSLVPDKGGLILRLPNPGGKNGLREIKEAVKIRQVYEESSHWGSILGIDTVGSLNEAVCNRRGKDIIRINEALHEKRLASIADDIYNNKKTIVLVAGPSSSGKTTFAARLCVQLSVLGLTPRTISLDNYFRDRDVVPRDESGNPDFESFDYLDRGLLNENLTGLLKGDEVKLPVFNFITGTREYNGNCLALSENDVLVIEGIHGLNSALTENVPDHAKYKIFISAFTQINLDHHNRIPTSDSRLLRRIVRDMRTRGYSTEITLSIWESVMRGEEKNIFPFQQEADTIFNSALTYELCILKQYVEPLLFSITADNPAYTDARRLLACLDSFVAMPPDDVPGNSILREFIGGSCFRI